MNTAATAFIKKGEGRTVKAGGLWIFDNEIDRIEGEVNRGDILTVRDFNGYFLGTGYLNDASKIRIRLLTRNEEEVIDYTFFRKRIRAAWEYRKAVVDTGCCRLVFGEADFLPGLVIDKYDDILVVQSLAFGIDRWKQELIELMKETLAADGIVIRGVYERSDAKVRDQEGMTREKGFLSEPFNTLVQIRENDLLFEVDIAEGQKTGYFLDQKYNRFAVRKLCRDAKVLDLFTHTGSFALNCAAGGAREVIGVDCSQLGVDQAIRNSKLNHMEDRVSFVCADVFDYLTQARQENRQYDVIILDPPAFTKSRNSVKQASKGYQQINSDAMRLLRDGGYLATCSCSHFMTQELFAAAIAAAAKMAHVRLRQIEFRTQSPDHPILWSADESYYLKFYLFQIVRER